jgi:hypothetical protein
MDVEIDDQLVLRVSIEGRQWIIETMRDQPRREIFGEIGARLYAELLVEAGSLRPWTVLGRHQFLLQITLEAFASFESLKAQAGSCAGHCRRFIDPISLAEHQNGCCVNTQCYDPQGIEGWYQAHPESFGHGQVPHNRSNKSPEEFQELCRLTRLFRQGVRESLPSPLQPEAESEEEW